MWLLQGEPLGIFRHARKCLRNGPRIGTVCLRGGSSTDPPRVRHRARNRVFRGGSWRRAPGANLRSAMRSSITPGNRSNIIGFRVGFQFQPDTASPELELFGGAEVPHKRDEPWAGTRLRSERRAGRKFDRLGKHHRQPGRQCHRDLPFDLFGDGCGGQFESNLTRTVRVVDHFIDLNDSVSLDMIWVEPGTFTMGSPTSEADRGHG